MKGRGFSMSSLLSSINSIPPPRPARSIPSSQEAQNPEQKPEINPDALPIMGYREDIMKKINSSPVTIISADTGSGKVIENKYLKVIISPETRHFHPIQTTQVPQFILDDATSRGQPCNILVCQPRKIAAMTIARRVAQERNCELGMEVGYQVGLKKKVDTEAHGTRLLFCTTGVIIEKLIQEKHMVNYTHVILDEVHEREIDQDLLMIIVKDFLMLNSKSTKVILMSATFSPKAFVDYFKLSINGSDVVVPSVVTLKTDRKFTIKKFYADDLRHLNIDYATRSSPGISLELFKATKNLILERLKKSQKSILVFLPGIYEIKSFRAVLQADDALKESYLICVLHSSLSIDDQRIAFMSANKPKIVLSTNIAESSITITNPEVDCVIDFGLTKYIQMTENAAMASLKLDWTSQNSMEQRAGRTGRTCDGVVYRMIPEHFFKTLRLNLPPEMIRCPLETVVLRIKILDIGSPNEMLSKAMNSPHPNIVRRSILTLKELGALQRLNSDGSIVHDGKLTYVGRIMAALPLDVRVTKFVITGYLLSVLDEAIVIAAGLNAKSIFKQDISDYKRKLAWADGSACDLISILNAYNLWKLMSEQGHFTSWDVEKQWCKQFNLERKSLHEMRELVNEIKERLTSLNMEPMKGAHAIIFDAKEKPLMLKICAAGAFIPNFFIFGKLTEDYQAEIFKETAGRNPENTVYFKKMDTQYRAYGKIYEAQFKEKLVEARICRSPEDVKVIFDKGGSKVFVQFHDEALMVDSDEYDDIGKKYHQRESSTVAGRVRTEIYKAVKLRKEGWNLTLNLMSLEDTVAYAAKYNIDSESRSSFDAKDNMKHPEMCVIPITCVDEYEGIVTHVVHCSKFYIQPATEENEKILTNIQECLSENLFGFESVAELERYQLVIACDIEATTMKRARVVDVDSKENTVMCFMIDYGETKKLSLDLIGRIADSHKDCFEIPERCFEATLSEVAPSINKCPRGKWTSGAVKKFCELAMTFKLFIVVHSVIEDVASVQLWNGDDNINDELVELGYAQTCVEGFTRTHDHELRKSVQSQYLSRYGAKLEFIRRTDTINKVYVPSPPLQKCNNQLRLHGPISPLETKPINILVEIPLGTTEITVGPASVNSVLLMGDPGSIHGQLLVSANTVKSRNGTVLHDTTIIPDIPGIAVLLAMMFAPNVIFRRNANRTMYECVQFGLGGDPVTNKPIFQEHDCVLPVNIELDKTDFTDVNYLRFIMSHLLKTEPTEIIPSLEDSTKFDLLWLIPKQIMKILARNRGHLPSCDQIQDLTSWKTENQSDGVSWKETIEGGSLFTFIIFPPLRKLPEGQKANLLNRLSVARQETM